MNIEKSVYFAHDTKSYGEVDTTTAPILRLNQVNLVSKEGVSRLKEVTFEVLPGEIFGIAGVAGNGQRELAEVAAGIVPPTNGKIEQNGKDVTGVPVGERLRSGLSYIPEDRLHDGFLPKASVAQNLILGVHRQPPYSDGHFINWKTVYQNTREQIGEYNIKTGGPEEPGGNLSGGNIQRVMIARAFSMNADLLIAHNPTRGLDIPSMDFVYQKMLQRKAQKQATLLISEDLDELMLLSDRIAVIYRGEILGILPREAFDKYAIGRLMGGIRSTEPATP